MSENIEELVARFTAEVRALREQFGLETLLPYAKAAERFGLKVTQFKARYIATKRLLVVKDGGQPRVLLSEVNQVLEDLKKQAAEEAGRPPPAVKPAPRTSRSTRSRGARDELAKLDAALRSKRH